MLICAAIMDKPLEILQFFVTDENQTSQSQLNNVIEKSYRIALKYLHFQRLKISKLILNEDLTLEEIAIDSIAALFVKENENNLISIKQTFNNWQPAIKSEADFIFFLNKVVASRVEQHIFKLLKEADPFFSKLLDSLNYLIKRNECTKINFLGKTYISKTNEDQFDKCFISTDEFEKLPVCLFQNKKTLLNDLFNHLKNETDYNPAIPLNGLISKLKHINFSDYLVIEFVSSDFRKIEVNQIIEEGYSFAIEKLINSYVEKGKLDYKEQIAFKTALKEMASDLSDGGINPGLYHYLSPHLVGLSEIEYKSKYHNILEYLLKVMKNNIAKKLTEKD